MHSFEYRNGKLHCEEVDLAPLAANHGTPLYVYSANTIRGHYRRLDAAFEDIPHLICYAVKANSNIGILNLLARENSGFDIVSAGELYRVIQAGGDPGKCTFAGVGKTEAEVRYALEQGILAFNIESEAELHFINEVAQAMGRRAPISLRVNPDVDAKTHKYISTGKSENKFGIAFERIRDVYRTASEMPGIEIRGVQMHIGSQITEVTPFAEAVAKMVPLVEELKRLYGISYFSIGGGIGIVYDDTLASGTPCWWGCKEKEGQLTIKTYAEATLPLLKPLGLQIVFEPGRYMVGNAGVLLAKTLYRKKGGQKQFVIVDTAMNDLIRPALYEGYHEIVPLQQPNCEERETVDVVGPVCESGDFLAQNRTIPVLHEGDYLAVMSAGAYGFTMASNYNSRPLPAELLIDNDRVSVIRERQRLEDLVAGESIPSTN